MSKNRASSRKKEDLLKQKEEGFNSYMGGANEPRAKEKNKNIHERNMSKGKPNNRNNSKDNIKNIPKVEKSPENNVS